MSRGGARPGAGRPPTGNSPRKVWLPEWVVDELRAAGDGSVSKGIIRVIEQRAVDKTVAKTSPQG